MRSALLALLILLTFSGCDSGGEDPPATLTGRWIGETTAASNFYRFEMDLREGAALSGSGTMQVNRTPVQTPFTISGVVATGALSISMSFSDRPPVLFTGRVDDARRNITGTLNQSGFGGETLVLKRQ